MRYAHVTNFVLDHPWALTQPYREVIAGVLARRIAGRGADEEGIALAALKREQLPQPRRGGTIAIVPIHGIIAPRADAFTEVSGLVSLDTLAALNDALVADAGIKTIVWHVDSPGGTVAGCPEFAAKARAWAAQKPIIAVASYTMASAAYWICSAATEIICSPSAKVGSIGVYTIHDDLSAALKELGINRSYIYAGKYKVLGNETEALDKVARTQIQAMVDEAMAMFVGDVAKGRSVGVDVVRKDYGEGRTVGADEALALGLVDKIGTLDDTIARLTPASVTVVAEANSPELRAQDAAWLNALYAELQTATI